MASAITSAGDTKATTHCCRERIARGEKVELTYAEVEQVFNLESLAEKCSHDSAMLFDDFTVPDSLQFVCDSEEYTVINRSHLYLLEHIFPSMINILKFDIPTMIDSSLSLRSGEMTSLSKAQLIGCCLHLSFEVQELCNSWNKKNLQELSELDPNSFDKSKEQLMSIAFRIHFIVEYILRSLNEMHPTRNNRHFTLIQSSGKGDFKECDSLRFRFCSQESYWGELHKINDLEGLHAQTKKVVEESWNRYSESDTRLVEIMRRLQYLFNDVARKNGPFIQSRLKLAHSLYHSINKDSLTGPFYRG